MAIAHLDIRMDIAVVAVYRQGREMCRGPRNVSS
jgi:hypothetical protein